MNSNSNPSLNTMTRTTAMPLSGHKVQLRSHSPFVDFAIEVFFIFIYKIVLIFIFFKTNILRKI
jgi:hypothetical protein